MSPLHTHCTRSSPAPNFSLSTGDPDGGSAGIRTQGGYEPHRLSRSAPSAARTRYLRARGYTADSRRPNPQRMRGRSRSGPTSSTTAASGPTTAPPLVRQRGGLAYGQPATTWRGTPNRSPLCLDLGGGCDHGAHRSVDINIVFRCLNTNNKRVMHALITLIQRRTSFPPSTDRMNRNHAFFSEGRRRPTPDIRMQRARLSLRICPEEPAFFSF